MKTCELVEYVQRKGEEKSLLFTVDGKLYDVNEFAHKHPGGEKILRLVAGSDATKYMQGLERIKGVKHEHSKAAYDILERYAVDHRIEKDTLLDDKNPILWKVGNLKSRYWTWIHQPYEGSLRLFDSDFLENLTRTKWWVVPLVWMPLVIFFALSGVFSFTRLFGLTKGTIVAGSAFFVGALAWTLLEYTLHRTVFHWKPDCKSYNQITLHFLLHGLHHKTPMDGDRLVFPPVPALLIIGFFYAIYKTLLPDPLFCCFASGKLFGYICYDLSHYYLHHGSPEPHSNMHYRKVYHHNHHFKDHDQGFGISTVLWDHVFGTVGSGPL
ncbi:Fatty acid 2-hydroxylase [Aphelenchoides besseyi]|nr:Fatty acid 2-hydroxylase [Aphelenchoides besseyi]